MNVCMYLLVSILRADREQHDPHPLASQIPVTILKLKSNPGVSFYQSIHRRIQIQISGPSDPWSTPSLMP